MKPAPLAYLAAPSLESALSALAERPEDARVLAGGQSLMPMLNLRLVRPGLLVDINGIPGLGFVSQDERGIRVGATVRHAELLAHVSRSDSYPLLAMALPYVAHLAVRNRGTVCGSLALADPAAELPACAVCLGAELTLASRRGRRIVRAADFFRGLYETALAPDELIVDVLFPRADAGWHFAFDEVSRRHGDFAIAGLAGAIRTDDGIVTGAGITLFGVADRPVRAELAESHLIGQALSDPAARERAVAALAAVEMEASGEYPVDAKRHLAGVLLRRMLARAVDRRS